MTTHYIPADEEIAAKGDEAHVRCCGRPVRHLPDGDDMADPAWPGVKVTCVGREHLERDGSVGTVHRAPVGDERRVPCCGRLLTELPFNDRIALRGTPAENTTNCPGPGVGGRSVTHRYPPSGDEHDAMPCCGRAVVEVPDTDGMAETDELVTCPGPRTPTVHRCPDGDIGPDTPVPCCGLAMTAVHEAGDLVADPTGDNPPDVTCPGDPRSTPQAAAERAAWTKDLAAILRGQIAVDPKLLPGLTYAAALLDPAGTPEPEATPGLAALREQVEVRAGRIGQLVQQAMTVKKINPLSLEAAELRIRLEVLSDAAFGDGTRDQLGYELAVQDKFIAVVEKYVGKADEIRAAREAEARRSALLDGVNGFRPPPGGRP
jgi:hypothetical protein